MISRLYLVSLFIVNALFLGAQTVYSVMAPPAVIQKCDEVIRAEVGKNTFNNSVKYIKSDVASGNYSNGEKWESFTVFYAFVFPEIKESHVVFSLNCLKDSKGIRLVKDSAFRNYTRLPASLSNKNLKLISYQSAKKIASEHNAEMRSNSDKLFGEISTEYNDKLKDYSFVWHFYYMAPCKNCGNEQFRIYSSSIDAVNGKPMDIPAK